MCLHLSLFIHTVLKSHIHPSHPHICTSSHLHTFTSSHLHTLTSRWLSSLWWTLNSSRGSVSLLPKDVSSMAHQVVAIATWSLSDVMYCCWCMTLFIFIFCSCVPLPLCLPFLPLSSPSVSFFPPSLSPLPFPLPSLSHTCRYWQDTVSSCSC